MTEHRDDVMRAVAERALEQWDLGAARLRLISRSENVTFRVDNDRGETFVLRLHRPGYHMLAELNSEQAWTAALRQAGIGVPEFHRTRNGAYYADVGVPGTTESRHVGVVDWFEGVTLDEQAKIGPDGRFQAVHFERLGRLIARMHNATERWEPARLLRTARVRRGRLDGPRPLLGAVLGVFGVDAKPAPNRVGRAHRVSREAVDPCQGFEAIRHDSRRPDPVERAGDRR